jgi:hypothetical protein
MGLLVSRFSFHRESTRFFECCLCSNSQSDDELFTSQQTYMYFVLIDRLQTETAQAMLREHETDKNSQKIIAEIVDYYEKSSKAKNRASTLFSQITSMKIHTTRWNGTMRAFILHWVDKVREYHRLSGPSNVINEFWLPFLLLLRVTDDHIIQFEIRLK